MFLLSFLLISSILNYNFSRLQIIKNKLLSFHFQKAVLVRKLELLNFRYLVYNEDQLHHETNNIYNFFNKIKNKHKNTGQF